MGGLDLNGGCRGQGRENPKQFRKGQSKKIVRHRERASGKTGVGSPRASKGLVGQKEGKKEKESTVVEIDKKPK